MRKNEYTSLDDFYYEYANGRASSWEDENHRQRFMGIEFKYKEKYWRLCREPLDAVPADARGRFRVVQIIIKKNMTYPAMDYYILIGWYKTLDEVLDECFIEGHPFREVIMDDDTEILGQD